MFQFGNSEQNSQIPFYSGMPSDYQICWPVQQVEQQKTLQTLKLQTDYLVSQINGIKEVLGEFIGEVKTQLSTMTQNIMALQRANEMQKPKKKFKKIINCPYQDCGRRYSSKIALNCHIRTKHLPRKE